MPLTWHKQKSASLALLLLFAFLIVPSLQFTDTEDGNSRTERLERKRSQDALISLRGMKDFNEYLVRGHRNYSVVVLLNRSNKKNCYPCTYAEDALRHLASLYSEQVQDREGPQQPLFFAQILNGKFGALFRKLEVEHVPSLLFFPPDGMLSNLKRFENPNGMMDVFKIRDFISTSTEQQVNLMVEEMEEEEGGSSITFKSLLYVSVGLASVFFLFRQNFKRMGERFLDGALTAYGVMTLVIILIGGHIYNHIEKPEYGSTEGLDSMIHDGYDYQFQIEAYLVSAICKGYIMSLEDFGVCFAFLQLIEGRRLILTKGKGGNARSAFALLLSAGTLYILHYVTNIKM